MKTTAYFRHTRTRRDRAWIKDEWIETVLQMPIGTRIQTDGRVRRWAWIEEAVRNDRQNGYAFSQKILLRVKPHDTGTNEEI